MAELKRINKRDYFLMEEKLKQWQSYDVNKVCNNQTQIFSEIQMGNKFFRITFSMAYNFLCSFYYALLPIFIKWKTTVVPIIFS